MEPRYKATPSNIHCIIPEEFILCAYTHRLLVPFLKSIQEISSIFLVQLGDENVVDFDTDFDKGIMLYIAKIEKNADPLAAPNGMDPTSKKDTIIDGQKARIYNSGEVYAVAKNGYGYLMILGSEANQATKDNFMKIVASFKFTN